MRVRTPALVMTCLLATGCGMYQQHEAEKQVRASLRDPDSAKFSEIAVFGDGVLACGMVNAKNGMGGYMGPTGFMLWQGRVFFEDDEHPVSQCCTSMRQAVVQRVDSADLPGFASACGAYVNGFAWPRK